MRIVIKIGTSTLAHPTGHLNIRRVEELCMVISDIKNAGHEVILVSSGAIGMGIGKLGLRERPTDMPTKQAAAAVGQCELMYIQHHPDHHRRRESRRSRHSGSQRQADRYLPPRPDPDRLHRRPRLRNRETGYRRSRQRRRQSRRRFGTNARRFGLLRRPDRPRGRRRPNLQLDLRSGMDDGHRRQHGQNLVLVRQRNGLQHPRRRPHLQARQHVI